MGTEQCPHNMCDHSLEDHYIEDEPFEHTRCKANECNCGIFYVDEETWNWLNNP